MCIGGLGGGHDLRLRRVWPAIAQVLQHGPGEQIDVLLHHPHMPAQGVQGKVPHIDPVHQDRPLRRLVKPRDQRAERALPHPRGAHQGHELPWPDVQRQVAQHMRPVVVIAEPHIAEAHRAPGLRQLHRPRPVLDIRRRLQDLHHPGEPRIALLPEPHEIGQPLHRVHQHRHAQQEGQHVPHAELRLRHPHGAQHDHAHGHQLREGRGADGEERLAAIARPAALKEPGVLRLEPPALQRLVGEGLHHPDPGQRVLHPLIDRPDLLLAHLQGGVHPAAEVQGIGHRHRHQPQDHPGQRPVQARQDQHRARELQHRDRQVLRPVMIELAEREQVVGDPAHQLPDPLAVIEAERQSLAVLEQGAAQGALHLRPHHMALIVDEQGAYRLGRQQGQHDHPHGVDLAQHAGPVMPGGEPAGDVVGAERQEQRRHRDDHGAAHIRRQQRDMGSVIGEERLHPGQGEGGIAGKPPGWPRAPKGAGRWDV